MTVESVEVTRVLEAINAAKANHRSLTDREAARVVDDAMFEWACNHGVPGAGEGRLAMVRHGLRALGEWLAEVQPSAAKQAE